MVERTLRLTLGDASPTARLLYGVDVREGLRLLPEASIHTVCTSPPYWGLRDYGVDPLIWGGDSACSHEWGAELPHGRRGNRGVSGTGGNMHPSLDVSGQGPGAGGGGQFCQKCSAWQGDLGLEPTPDMFVEHIVEVFREVRRVLRPDGTLWVNMGDSYAAQRGGSHQPAETLAGGTGGVTDDGDRVNRGRHDGYSPSRNASAIGLKHKDLIGIPWRVAFALQADGWYLRSDIIWSKPNPMPESVTDRPTKSHEYVFMFAHPDSGGRYFYDSVAVREPFADERQGRDGGKQASERNRGGRTDGYTKPNGIDPSENGGKNKRTVWSVNPRPYKGAHFATWPPELVGTMIKAGTSARGVCSECGTPCQVEPACACNAPSVPATVLDPFSGSATTGHVALRLGRAYVGTDLNEEYLPMAEARVLGNDAPDVQESVVGSVLDLFGEE